MLTTTTRNKNPEFLEGGIGDMVNALIEADAAERLAELAGGA